MKYVTILIALLFSLAVQAQDLKGKWIIAKDSATVSLIETTLLKFSEFDLSIYDFKDFKSIHSYSYKNDSLYVDHRPWGHLEFVNQNRIRIEVRDEYQQPFKTDYVRLVPTKTPNTLEELNEFTYYYKTEKEVDTIFLGVQLMARPDKLKRYEIEQIDSTLLLTSFKFGKRFKSMPILNAYENFIRLDGLSDKPYTLRAGRIYELPEIDLSFLEEDEDTEGEDDKNNN
jgi:hypothetical protein